MHVPTRGTQTPTYTWGSQLSRLGVTMNDQLTSTSSPKAHCPLGVSPGSHRPPLATRPVLRGAQEHLFEKGLRNLKFIL